MIAPLEWRAVYVCVKAAGLYALGNMAMAVCGVSALAGLSLLTFTGCPRLLGSGALAGLSLLINLHYLSSLTCPALVLALSGLSLLPSFTCLRRR